MKMCVALAISNDLYYINYQYKHKMFVLTAHPDLNIGIKNIKACKDIIPIYPDIKSGFGFAELEYCGKFIDLCVINVDTNNGTVIAKELQQAIMNLYPEILI